METCDHAHDEDKSRECGEPATHDGIVPGGGGRVAVCERHAREAEADGALMFVSLLASDQEQAST